MAAQLPQGLEVLRAQLGIGGQSAAALAFLANCVKDHGAVTAAVELFRNVSISLLLPGSYQEVCTTSVSNNFTTCVV